MKILVVDDHSLFRRGIEAMLTTLSPMAEISEASNCKEAINAYQHTEDFDLILLDYHMPGTDPHQNINDTKESFPTAKVVILSGEEDPQKILGAIEHGVAGFIPKSSDPEVLIAALQLILAGGVYLPELVIAEANQVAVKVTPPEHSPLENLSERQIQVLHKAIDGKVNKVIARELDLSLGTVKAHLSAAYRALGVSNRTEALFVTSKYLQNESR